MAGPTKIEWTDKTWNPVTGCVKVSEGCRNCYAERLAERFWKQRRFNQVMLHPERIEWPLEWRKPSRIFVNSMSDLFFHSVPDDFIFKIFNTMMEAKHHTFQILTKRPQRMKELSNEYAIRKTLWPPENVWFGVSVENQETADERIPLLLQTLVGVRFVSAEPLLGPIDFSKWIENRRPVKEPAIHLIIVGGESGPNHRSFDLNWAYDIHRQCREVNIPFFMKQDSGPKPGMKGRIPDDLWFKQIP